MDILYQLKVIRNTILSIFNACNQSLKIGKYADKDKNKQNSDNNVSDK